MASLQPVPDAATRFHRDTFSTFHIQPWTVHDSSVELNYGLDDALSFTETVGFPRDIDLTIDGMRGALDLLALVAGVSYFKVASPRHIAVDTGPLSPAAYELLGLLYDEGLREYAYRNDLGVPLVTAIVGDRHEARPRPTASNHPLLPMGGGRDSGLLASLARGRDPLLLTVGNNVYVEHLSKLLNLEFHTTRRSLSPNIGALNRGPGLNGHVPVTAINSMVGVVGALMFGRDSVIMANESSASSATVTTPDGFEVNHQFSKSLRAERALQAALQAEGVPIAYFSAMRPYGELAIARAFATKPELFPIIMSCNRAFIRDPELRSDGWCGQCAKCRFVYLTLAPFTDPPALAAMFGRDLLASTDPDDQAGFAELLSDARPFDCVGEVSEARLAVGLLTVDPRWNDRPVVQTLAPLVPPIDPDALAHALAPQPDHDVPAEILADLAPAFGSAA